MKHTKHKLLSSIATLLVCFAMFIGSTYAWFTDSASTGVNKIQAGNLDIKVTHQTGSGSYVDVDLNTHLFADVDLWEPGVVAYENIKVENVGNLAAKVKITLRDVKKNQTADGHNLTEVIKVNVVDGGFSGTRDDAMSLAGFLPLDSFDKSFALNANTGTPDSKTFGIVLHWEPSVNDNDYNLNNGAIADDGRNYLDIQFGLNVVATQNTVESDSFDNQYDANATYPTLGSVINRTDEIPLTGFTIYSTTTTDSTGKLVGETQITDTDGGKLEKTIKTTDATSTSTTYDISYNFVKDGTSTPVVAFDTVQTNTIQLSSGLNNVKVSHSHGSITTEMTIGTADNQVDGTYYYDRTTGTLTIHSKIYSTFDVTYTSNYIASVDGQGYAELQEAFNNASDNSTVFLLKDVNLSADVSIGSGTKSINFNMNGKTVDCGTKQIYTSGDGTVTIYGDGLIKNSNTERNSNCASLYIPTGSNVVLNSVNLDGHYGVYVNGNLTIRKATINAVDCGIAVNYNAIVNIGSETEHNIVVNASDGNCISTQAGAGMSDMVVNVYGGNFISNTTVMDKDAYLDCPIYWASHGTLNVYGGTFKNITDSNQAAGILQKNGTVIISDGIFEAKDGIKIVAQKDSTEITTSIVGGNFTGTRSGIYIDASNSTYMGQLTEYEVSIDNGDTTPTFIGGTEKAIYAKTGGLGDKKLMLISGGEFNEDPSEYVVEGKMAVLSDGVYHVVNDTRVKTEDQLITAVEQGGEFTLGADIQLTGSLNISKDVTINLESFKINSATTKPAIVLKSDGAPVKVLVNATTGGVSASGSSGDCFEMPWYNDSTAELTVNGGTYTSDKGYFVDINSGSSSPETRKDKLYINGCTYTGKNIINANPANTEIVMTSGNLTGTNKGIVLGTNSTNAKFTMTGGSITYELGSVITAQASGNTIDISDDAMVTGKLSLTNCTMNIHGGTVNITGTNTDNRALMMNDGATLNISDTAKVNGNPLFNMNGGSVNITGGSFKGKIVNGLNYGNDYLKSVEDLLIDGYYLSEADSDGWYQVIHS